ncbi:hypothetical protein C8A01DRAFT_47360 [Parachaetomium inaequale]|uniref:Defect at low temperature protein 1 n=1 Tax=Parachaetomium inaequale TaxID=2588326 RepID=A0AAN6SR25_9PEZI|nr:hypothetical protein C8A01DRAFT_47360 [Parachaetomium inaequale]
MSAASLLFLIVYNFLYYFLYLILFAFLVVTPIDLVQQGAQSGRNYDILVVIVCYVATILVVAFIYATRLYISRSVLASIPKAWVPVEKGDVAPDVRQMIVEGISRSAAIAYEARPRVPLVVLAQEPAAGDGGNRQGLSSSSPPGLSPSGTRKSAAPEDARAAELPPVWGEIEHPGWASPTSHDLPNLQYDTVVSELPNLIEAKAITLAPPDPESNAEPPALDPDAVALLQRPESMGLREYLMYLTELAVLAPLPTTGEFLARYEAARYSGRPLSNAQFRGLMHLFAEILHNMHPLSPAALAQFEDDGSSGGAPPPSESDIDNDAPRRGGTTSPSSMAGTARRASSSSTAGSASSGGRLRPELGVRNSSANTWQTQFRTAPTTPRSRHTGFSGGRASSEESFAHTRHPYPASLQSSSSGSGASARSAAAGGGGGSVIRLAGSEDATELPYVLTYEPSR